MTTIEEVKSQIATSREQLQKEKELVAQKRQEAQEIESKISEQEKKIPVPTQKTLRSGLFAGLEGRKRRQVIAGLKQEVEHKKGEIGIFKSELAKYEEKELKPFETQITQKEEEVSAYEKRVTDYNKGYKLGIEGFQYPMYLEGDMLQGWKDARKQLRYMENFSAQIPTTPAQLTKEIKIMGGKVYRGGVLVGIEDPILKITRPPTIIEQKIYGTIKTTPVSPTFYYTPFKTSVPRDLSRTDLIKDSSKLSSFNISQPSKDVKDLFNTSFRTTGSPIRMTKLSSIKSRGYIPTHIKPKIQQKIIPRKEKTYFISRSISLPKGSTPKSKSGNGLFFKKRKKKKKSIWGF